jgi:hypothetical protein
MKRHLTCLMLLALSGAPTAMAQQQVVDPDFRAVVGSPAYVANGPVVAIDEGHGNFHTMGGQYRPFAELLKADGYRVQASTAKFAAAAFEGVDLLVIANAEADGGPAFTAAEADALHDWVKGGGSLLLIADHAPFGAAAEILGARFGVMMGKGWVYQPTADGITTQLVFSRDNQRLGQHPILEGRPGKDERIDLVRAFTGQSLSIPRNASVLLRLGPDAREAPHTDDLNAAGALAAAKDSSSAPNTRRAGGRAQGVAMTLGKGRVVVLGEAGMFTAQAVTFPPGQESRNFKFGMNVPGTDDQQFALNVMHWLSRIIG